MDQRPGVAVVTNLLPPYRVHLHQRIVREMETEIVLHTVCTHEVDYMRSFVPPADINAISFGPGHSLTRQLRLRYAGSEWLKGGRIIRWLLKNDVKAVVLNGYNDAGRIRILYWCYRHGIPCLLFSDSNIRGDRAGGTKAFLKKMVLGRVVRWTTALMVCGRLGQQYWEKYGGNARNMFKLPYEPDYGLIRNLPDENITQVRERFGLRPDRRRIVFSGRFVEAKRPQLLIDAFIRIARHRPNWDLVMVGGEDPLFSSPGQIGPENVPSELRDRIVFTGFFDQQWMVSAIYRASDVLCLPSDYEPWALVVNEAAAAGMAIVASDVVGAAAELVRDGFNGRIFPAGDLAALTEALLYVTAPERIDAMRANSASVLADWRESADPIEGLRKALKFTNVI